MKNLKEKFIEQTGQLPITHMTDQVPGLYLFIKDKEGRHILGNNRTLKRCRCKTEEDIIGKTDFDFYPEELCIKYRQDDLKVIETGEPILELSELAINETGAVDWFITNKFPIFDKKGNVIGLMGTTIEHDKSYASYDNYSELYPAVEYLRNNFTKKITVTELADKVNMSVRQFQRKFKERFHESFRDYIIRLRIHWACDLIRNTDESLAIIALDAGFYDQSSFSKQFKNLLGMTPIEYRKNN